MRQPIQTQHLVLLDFLLGQPTTFSDQPLYDSDQDSMIPARSTSISSPSGVAQSAWLRLTTFSEVEADTWQPTRSPTVEESRKTIGSVSGSLAKLRDTSFRQSSSSSSNPPFHSMNMSTVCGTFCGCWCFGSLPSGELLELGVQRTPSFSRPLSLPNQIEQIAAAVCLTSPHILLNNSGCWQR